MNQKFKQSIYHANVNVNLIKENRIQMKSEITINVNECVKIQKNIVYEIDYIWNPATCS